MHGLINGKVLERHRLQKVALYTSIDSDIASKQMAARREKIKSGLKVATVVSLEVTIAVLVEALRAGEILVPATTVAARLNAQGMTISVDQVQQIFSQYGVAADKKGRATLKTLSALRKQAPTLNNRFIRSVLDLSGVVVTEKEQPGCCEICQGPMRVQKSFQHEGRSIAHGTSTVNETIWVCAAKCRFRSGQLVTHRAHSVVQCIIPDSIAGYDLMV